MLVRADGQPYANPEILARLHEIDGGLGLHFFTGINLWGVTLKWPPNDPRREMVRRGELGDDQFDTIAYLPAGCTPDDAYGYIVNNFKAWSGTKDEVKRLLDRVHMYNKQVKADALKPTLDYADELLEANASTLFRNEKGHIPKVYMTEPGPRKKKHKEL